MKTILSLLPCILALPLASQAPPVSGSTATDFGSLASANTASDFHSVDANTAITRALNVGAHAGGSTMPRTPAAFAEAMSSVVLGGMTMTGGGAEVRESGFAAGVAASDTASSGTSSSNHASTSPVRGPHGVSITFAAAANSTGTVDLIWRGFATTGASTTVDVDVNGDNVPDFHGAAGTPAQQQFPVTAGPNGVVIAVTSQGAADVTGMGHASYEGSLVVVFHGTVTPPTITFTAFGPSCTGTLSGQTVTTPRGPGIELDVAGGPANGFGVLLAAGAPLTTPMPIPNSQCTLLIARHMPVGFLRLDATGAGSDRTRLPNRLPLDVYFQVVTVDHSSTTPAIGSTNGLHVHAQ
jgi:hypothetical protein